MLISRVIDAGRVVRVQRAEHQVAGERRLHGDASPSPASRISPSITTSGS